MAENSKQEREQNYGFAVMSIQYKFTVGEKGATLCGDGLMGVLPVYRTKPAARKAHGRKVKLMEVWHYGGE